MQEKQSELVSQPDSSGVVDKTQEGASHNEKQDINSPSLISEILRLEKELTFITGKANRAEVEELLSAKRKEYEEGQGKIFEEEMAKNYESGMSFTPSQSTAIQDLLNSNVAVNTFLATHKVDTSSDLKIKPALDWYIKNYRTAGRIAVSKTGYNSNTQELDAAVLSYEKAFGLDSEPIRSLNIVRHELEESKKSVNNLIRDIEKVFEEKGKLETLGIINKKDYVPYADFHELRHLTQLFIFQQSELVSLQDEYTALVQK